MTTLIKHRPWEHDVPYHFPHQMDELLRCWFFSVKSRFVSLPIHQLNFGPIFCIQLHSYICWKPFSFTCNPWHQLFAPSSLINNLVSKWTAQGDCVSVQKFPFENKHRSDTKWRSLFFLFAFVRWQINVSVFPPVLNADPCHHLLIYSCVINLLRDSSFFTAHHSICTIGYCECLLFYFKFQMRHTLRVSSDPLQPISAIFVLCYLFWGTLCNLNIYICTFFPMTMRIGKLTFNSCVFFTIFRFAWYFMIQNISNKSVNQRLMCNATSARSTWTIHSTAVRGRRAYKKSPIHLVFQFTWMLSILRRNKGWKFFSRIFTIIFRGSKLADKRKQGSKN